MNFFKEEVGGGEAARLGAAGRRARAEVQGPQTQLYRGTHRAGEAVHWENTTSKLHGHVEVKMQVCEFGKGEACA